MHVSGANETARATSSQGVFRFYSVPSALVPTSVGVPTCCCLAAVGCVSLIGFICCLCASVPHLSKSALISAVNGKTEGYTSQGGGTSRSNSWVTGTGFPENSAQEKNFLDISCACDVGVALCKCELAKYFDTRVFLLSYYQRIAFCPAPPRLPHPPAVPAPLFWAFNRRFRLIPYFCFDITGKNLITLGFHNFSSCIFRFFRRSGCKIYDNRSLPPWGAFDNWNLKEGSEMHTALELMLLP